MADLLLHTARKAILFPITPMKMDLLANGIKGIELDRQHGFLWIGTQAGIVRFDGKHFTSYPSQTNAGAAFRVTVIAEEP